MPSLVATSVSLSRSNFLPSTGSSSKRQSPVSTNTPSGVLTITAVESGIEWFTLTSSIEKCLDTWITSCVSGFISIYSGL